MRIKLLALCLGLLTWQSCGDDSSDPAAVEVTELLGPGELSIVDAGDGSVTLYWNSSNPEDDFEGYNIYGGKVTAAELETFGASEGSSLQLLSQTGDPSDVAKNLLQALDYNSANEKALPGAPEKKAEEDQDEDDKPKFSFLPIHQKDSDGEPLVPTCQPAASTPDSNTGVIDCQALTSEDNRKSSGDVSSFGTNTFTINGLTAGESYCFLVFSVQEEGEEISQSSSTVECIVPKIKTTALTANVANQTYNSVDLNTFADTCSPTCPTELTLNSRTGSISQDDTDDNAAHAIHFEAYNTGDSVYLVGAKHVAIRDVGYFTSLTGLPEDMAPASFPATYSADPSASDKNILVGGNYTRPFASTVLQQNHVYLIAVGDRDGDYPTKFTYHWMHVVSDSGSIREDSNFKVTFLVNKTTDVL